MVACCQVRAVGVAGCQVRAVVIEFCQVRAVVLTSCQVRAVVETSCQVRAVVVTSCQVRPGKKHPCNKDTAFTQDISQVCIYNIGTIGHQAYKGFHASRNIGIK